MGTYILGITINDSQFITVYDEKGETLTENWCTEEEMKGYIKALEDLGYRERFKTINQTFGL